MPKMKETHIILDTPTVMRTPGIDEGIYRNNQIIQTHHFPKVIIKGDCLAHGSSARWGLSMSKMSASAKLRQDRR